MDALKPWHQDIADHVLAGQSEEDIALAVGRPLDYVRGIVRSPLFQLILADAEHDKLAAINRQARLQVANALPNAIRTFVSGLGAEREGHRQKAAGRLVDTHVKLNARSMAESELTDKALEEHVTEARAMQRARLTIAGLGTRVEAPRVRLLDDVLAEYANADREP